MKKLILTADGFILLPPASAGTTSSSDIRTDVNTPDSRATRTKPVKAQTIMKIRPGMDDGALSPYL